MIRQSVIFDVGRVLFDWDLRYLFAKLIPDPDELEWFVTNVVTPQWHFQHDAGRPLADMLPELKAECPDHVPLIDAYAARFNETIPAPMPGSLELVERLDAAGVPLFAITNFAAPFWAEYRAGQPLFDHFRDVVVSGVERIAKPDPAIYRLAEQRFGYPARAMLFIDDNRANIDAASALGWQVHHFAGAAALEADLRERDLLG